MPLYLLLPHVLMNGTPNCLLSHRPHFSMPLSLSHIERTIQHNKLVLTHGEGLTHNDLTLRNARLPGHAQDTDTLQRMVTLTPQQMDGQHATNGHATRNGWTRSGRTRNEWTSNGWTRSGWTRNKWTRNEWTRSGRIRSGRIEWT